MCMWNHIKVDIALCNHIKANIALSNEVLKDETYHTKTFSIVCFPKIVIYVSCALIQWSSIVLLGHKVDWKDTLLCIKKKSSLKCKQTKMVNALCKREAGLDYTFSWAN